MVATALWVVSTRNLENLATLHPQFWSNYVTLRFYEIFLKNSNCEIQETFRKIGAVICFSEWNAADIRFSDKIPIVENEILLVFYVVCFNSSGQN